MGMLELDSIDLQMINLLQTQGRISNVDLAAVVRLSPSSCLRRLNRLEDQGIITRYAALLKQKTLGLDVEAHLEVTLNKQETKAVKSFLQKVLDWPQVLACYALSGNADYCLEIVAPSLEAYSQFLMREVLGHPVVINTKSSFILQTIKKTNVLPLGHLWSVDTEAAVG